MAYVMAYGMAAYVYRGGGDIGVISMA